MSSKQALGEYGESIAQSTLIEQGYEILEMNWRHRRAEIDIIAKKDGIVIFVEVKTRSQDYLGKPESFITSRKRAMMADAASAYCSAINHTWEVRFDYISILVHNDDDYELKHFKDAFIP